MIGQKMAAAPCLSDFIALCFEGNAKQKGHVWYFSDYLLCIPPAMFLFFFFFSFFFFSPLSSNYFSFLSPSLSDNALRRKLCDAIVPAVSSFHPLGLMPVPCCRTPRAVPLPIMLLFSLEKWLGAPLPLPLFSIFSPSQGGWKQGG